MKSFFKGLFCLGFLLILSGSVTKAEDTMTIYADGTYIDVPLSWSAQYTKTPYIYMVKSPSEGDNDAFIENYNLVTEYLPAKYNNVKEYINDSLEAIKSITTDFELIETGDDYHIYECTFGKIHVAQVQFFYIRGNKGYVLTFSSTPESFDDYGDLFFKIADSFHTDDESGK